jgi:hypothetical protein
VRGLKGNGISNAIRYTIRNADLLADRYLKV